MNLETAKRIQARIITILAETDVSRQTAPMKRIREHATYALQEIERELDALRNTP